MVRAKPIPYGFVTDEWFQARVEIDLVTGCHLWKGKVGRDGYGRVLKGDKTRQAHRVALVLAGFNVPLDAVVDHLCRNRRCVNPAHLDVTTHRTNTRRGVSIVGRYLRAHDEGRCVNGHVLAEVGMYKAGSTYTCAQCRRDRRAEYLARKGQLLRTSKELPTVKEAR